MSTLKRRGNKGKEARGDQRTHRENEGSAAVVTPAFVLTPGQPFCENAGQHQKGQQHGGHTCWALHKALVIWLLLGGCSSQEGWEAPGMTQHHPAPGHGEKDMMAKPAGPHRSRPCTVAHPDRPILLSVQPKKLNSGEEALSPCLLAIITAEK